MPSAFIATIGDQSQVVTTAMALMLDHLERHGARRIDEMILVHTRPDVSDAGKKISAAVELVEMEVERYRRIDEIGSYRPAVLESSDITTEEDATAYFVRLHAIVDELKAAGKHVHICAAGGRKGMTALATSVAHMFLNPAGGDGLWLLWSSAAYMDSKKPRPSDKNQARLISIPLHAIVEYDLKEWRELQALFESMTAYEQQIVRAIASDGLTNVEVGGKLKRKDKSVENALRRGVYVKIGTVFPNRHISRVDVASIFSPYFKALDRRAKRDTTPRA